MHKCVWKSSLGLLSTEDSPGIASSGAACKRFWKMSTVLLSSPFQFLTSDSKNSHFSPALLIVGMGARLRLMCSETEQFCLQVIVISETKSLVESNWKVNKQNKIVVNSESYFRLLV